MLFSVHSKRVSAFFGYLERRKEMLMGMICIAIVFAICFASIQVASDTDDQIEDYWRKHGKRS